MCEILGWIFTCPVSLEAGFAFDFHLHHSEWETRQPSTCSHFCKCFFNRQPEKFEKSRMLIASMVGDDAALSLPQKENVIV